MARGGGVAVATSLVIVSVIVAVGCAGGRGGTAPPATRAPTPIAGRSSPRRGADSAHATATPTELRYALAGHAYTVQTIGMVTGVGDTLARVDTVRATTVVRFDPGERGFGLLRAKAVVHVHGAPRGASPTAPGAARPDSDRVDSATVSYVVDSVAQDSSSRDLRIVEGTLTQSECVYPQNTVDATVRDALFPSPRSLVAGTAWVDTLTTVTCRGAMLLTTVAVRRFTVTGGVGAAGGSVVTVSHSTTAILHGSAMRGGAGVVVTGQGTGARAARYDRATGSLLGSESDQELDLTVSVAGRVTPLHQSARTRVVAESTSAIR